MKSLVKLSQFCYSFKDIRTVLVTSNLRNSDELRIILLKVSVIACESGCRSAAPHPRTPQNALNFRGRRI